MDLKLTVRKKDKGYQWILTGKVSGKWKHLKSKQGYKRRNLAEIDGAKAMTEYKPTSGDGSMTLSEIHQILLDDGQKSLNTVRSYESWFGVFESLHDMKISDISYLDISKVLNAYAKDHKHSTMMSVKGHGYRIFEYARKKLRLDIVNHFEHYDLRAPRVSDRRSVVALTPQDIDLLVSKLEGATKLLTAFMGYCGLRIGEAHGVKFSDIKDGMLTVQRQRLFNGLEAPLKTSNSYRTVPMPTKLQKIIAEHPIQISGYLVPVRFNSEMLRRLYEKAGYKITPHMLRHSYATNCISAGIDFKTTAELLGDTVEMVMKTYSHVNEDMRDRAKKILINL